jgi:hypothetical protein
VVEVVEEGVGEELFGGAELAVGSTRWGNKPRRLSSGRCSRRKTTVGMSCGPASLAGAAGRLSVQEGRGDEAFLVVRARNNIEAAAGTEQSNEEHDRTREETKRNGRQLPR